MKLLTVVLTASALAIAGSALASEDLVKKSGCIGCHDMSAKKVGPTWKDIAAKASEADIVAAINNGSKGKYGKIPMPPSKQGAANADEIAKWIMSLK